MNIQLHGFFPRQAEAITKNIFELLPKGSEGTAMVCSTETMCDDPKGNFMPFIRVYSDFDHDFVIAKRVLSQVKLLRGGKKRVGVECVKLAQYFEV
jgi:hypothetical protein